MSRIVAYNRLHDGNWPSKTQWVEGEILIVQSIELGFSCSQGSTTSNEANKSAMLRAEWTITARRAVLRLAQMKYRYFVPERCKQNAIFSGTSHQNRSYLDNISTNRWYIVGFQQGHCSRKVTDENFKITLQILQVLTPKFYSTMVTLFQLYATDDFNASLQCFSHCKITAAKIGHHISPDYQWVWLTQRNKLLLLIC